MYKKLFLAVLGVYLFIGGGYCSTLPESSFADYLFENDMYESALLEYERLFFFNPQHPDSLLWVYKQGLCAIQLGDCNKVDEYFSKIPSESELFLKTVCVRARCFLSNKEYQKADSILSRFSTMEVQFIRGYSLLVRQNYDSSSYYLRLVGKESPFSIRARSLQLLVDSLQIFKPKKYYFAGLCSLFPGAGHCYSGNYRDGLVSFLIVSFFSGCALYYDYYNAPGRTAVMGTIAGIFYVSSIYGALVSVKLFNMNYYKVKLKHAAQIFRE